MITVTKREERRDKMVSQRQNVTSLEKDGDIFTQERSIEPRAM